MSHYNDIRDTADHNGVIRVSGDFLQHICMQLVREGKLVGLVTEHDLIVVASVLLEATLSEDN